MSERMFNAQDRESEPDAAAIDDGILVEDVIDGQVGLANVIENEPPPPMALVSAPPDLALHSPSTEIMGTPFTTESRFEYPFPDTASDPAEPVLITPSFPSFSLSASASLLSSSSSQPLTHSSSPPSITTHFPITLTLPAYSSTHPKMRATNPPVPPGLVKRRQRWTLGLLRRRSSSSQSTDSASSEPLEELTRERAASEPRARQVVILANHSASRPPR
ncbi:hypothetical protein H0H81_008685 [Sphagnurus paluster]|uniref:Uncharacterized protein n=1 Tax=Sphagnurus paluster TaxID=117069 RepID=A0A9P7FXD1_9AGAR|nr:hypothetical protein H0H81_008685 [Sphagnurus paluster]